MGLTGIPDDVIVAPATPPGVSALAIIRLSGKEAIAITQKIFTGKNLLVQPTHTLHHGLLKDGDEIIDDVVVSIFHEPNSFTKESAVEISCHGSHVIV